MNPKARKLTAKHKVSQPIRPAVNVINAPTYNIANILKKKLTDGIKLKQQYNTKNTKKFRKKIKELNIRLNTKMI
jgi:hypothetical protein